MYKYEVGQLYHPDRTRWPETVQFNWRANGYELTLFWASPKASEVRDVKTGVARFAFLAPDRRCLFFLFAFGMDGWSDSTYSYWRVPDDERSPVAESEHPERRALLTVTLVDADTGIIRVLRALTLSPEMTQALGAAVNEQALGDLVSASDSDRAIAEAYARYPSPDAMVAAAVASCVGGT